MENQNVENQEEVQEPATMLGGLKNLGIGLAILGAAYYFYITMSAYESGEGIRMNRILLLAYGLLGKTVTAGILGLIALLMAGLGIKEMVNSRKA
jgi:hypothetical protein